MRLTRFRKLERARPARDLPPPTPMASRGRIEALQTTADPRPAPLELATIGPEDQPFVRCLHCGGDNHVAAQSCMNCEASLDDPEQRAFNERLWERLRREARAEHAAAEQLRREAGGPVSPQPPQPELPGRDGWAPVVRPLVIAPTLALLGMIFGWKIALALAALGVAGYYLSRWEC